MLIKKQNEIQEFPFWKSFIQEFQLTQTQSNQFAHYLALITHYNELFNLTTITDPKNIVALHFQDSLKVVDYMQKDKILTIADVGSGAGLPGIPLKIYNPDWHLLLIEVNNKKIDFLNTVINELTLKNIEVIDLDWRTFLRKTDEPIDLFVSRAALHTPELLRMFKPGCVYNESRLIYWASQDWTLTDKEKSYFQKEEIYSIKNRKRRLIFFSKHEFDLAKL